jgi:bifunctional non-homologous end joining protein LigD
MPLEEYKDKRHFDRTPEPSGSVASGAREALRFVIQKHDASRLHYDFRLEMDGVLKSWAVPKGPSLDTKEKRLAVEVEDHPIEYGDFEGSIPEGEYGAGTVMVWDFGTYEPLEEPIQMHASGSIKVRLHGEKLEGGFALVRMKRKEGEKRDMWLLIKERDEFVRPQSEHDVLKALPDSAKTGRTMPEIAEGGATEAAGDEGADPSQLAGAVRAPLTERIEPQLATKVEKVPDGDEWLHEIKLDGYRALCRVDGDDVRFITRSGADWTSRFAALVEPVRALGLGSAWLDGEVTVLMPDGRTSFGGLQAELKRGATADLTYFAFDLLYTDGWDLRGVPLLDRKHALSRALRRAGSRVRYVEHVQGGGSEFHTQTCVHALEGSVSKRADGAYRAGRSKDWRKRRCLMHEEFAIVGFTRRSGAGKGLGALLLASLGPSGGLAYAGKVGTGWSEAEARRLVRTLEPAVIDAPVVEVPAAEARAVTWVEPLAYAEVAFVEWTESGRVRQASYLGIRQSGPRAAPAPDADGDAADRVAGIALTHPEKVLWSGIGVTKLELARYYERIADQMLPHLADRPLVFVRCPHGEGEACFYQKDTSTGFPSAMRRFPVEHDAGTVNYGVIEDAPGLVALVQLGVLEIHSWGSRTTDIELPDRLVFDLDPGPEVSSAEVADAARLVREALVALGMEAYLKTTGGKGLHVVTPVVPSLDWSRARDVAKAIADAVASADPAAYTTNPKKDRRVGRVYIDYVRNTRGATAVAAFSSRARPGAPVSMPVRWDDLDDVLKPGAFDIRTVPRITAATRDPWDGYSDAAVSLIDVSRRLGLDVV